MRLPLTGRWSIRSLTESDRRTALGFLQHEPVLNVYLISKLLEGRIEENSPYVSVQYKGRPVCIASLTSNVVICASRQEPESVLRPAVELIAERLVRRSSPVRAIISEVMLVEELWRTLQSWVSPPTVVRLNQPVYELRRTPVRASSLRKVRFSNEDDLPRLIAACAAMHREEVGIDPLERDASGYASRIRDLVRGRRSLLIEQEGEIAFKCEYSAVTPAAVQLMGVWTNPAMRRRGLARTGLNEICCEILRQGRAVTLFVNDFNAPAIFLYESLGFKRIGCNRALIW